MKLERLKMEILILEKYFSKKYRFENIGTSDEFLDVGIRTQSGNVYRLRIELALDYPNSLPKVYISYPKDLKTFNNNSLLSVSATMHTLSPKEGMPQICHLKSDNWNPNRSLFQIIMKARIWLEAFDAHKTSGKKLDEYLSENPNKK